MTNSPEDPERDNPFFEIVERYTQPIAEERYEAAEALSAELFGQIQADMLDDPSPVFQLWCQANGHKLLGQWDEAEAAYRQILALPELGPADPWRTHQYLSDLFRLLRRDADALDEARLATAAARTLDLGISLAMALAKETGCLLRVNQIDEAETAVAEGFSLLRDEPLFGQMRGALLVLRAEAALRRNRLVDAADDLDAAYQLLAPLDALATAAIGAWQEAVRRARHVASIWDEGDPHTQARLADMLGGLAAAFIENGQLEDASPVAAEREDIFNRTRLPGDA